MIEYIGSWLIFTILIFVAIMLFGVNLESRGKITVGVCSEIFITLIMIGLYLSKWKEIVV